MISKGFKDIFLWTLPLWGLAMVWFTFRGASYFPTWTSLVDMASRGYSVSDGVSSWINPAHWFNMLVDLSATMSKLASPSSLGAFGTGNPSDAWAFIANFLLAGIPFGGCMIAVFFVGLGTLVTAIVPLLNTIGYITVTDVTSLATSFGSMVNVWASSSSVWLGYGDTSSWTFSVG